MFIFMVESLSCCCLKYGFVIWSAVSLTFGTDTASLFQDCASLGAQWFPQIKHKQEIIRKIFIHKSYKTSSFPVCSPHDDLLEIFIHF